MLDGVQLNNPNYWDWYEKMCECDPDYIVDVLGVTSKELLDAFHKEAVRFWEEDQ